MTIILPVTERNRREIMRRVGLLVGGAIPFRHVAVAAGAVAYSMYSIQSDCRGNDLCILPIWTEALENKKQMYGNTSQWVSPSTQTLEMRF